LQAALGYVDEALEVFDPAHLPFSFEKVSRLKAEIEVALAAGDAP
jgi:hypothetical protein